METIAIYPGRFHPFHKGHAESFKQMAQEFGPNNTYLAISAKQEQPKSPFSAGDRAKMAMALGIPKENIISVNNTYGGDEYIQRFKKAGIDPDNTILVLGVSKKDMGSDPRFTFEPKKDGSMSYLQPYRKGPQEPMTKHAYIVSTDVAEFPIAGEVVRDASKIRDMYKQGDDQLKSKILTDLYGSKAAKLIKSIFDQNLTVNEAITIPKLNKIDLYYKPIGREEIKTVFKNLDYNMLDKMLKAIKQKHGIDASKFFWVPAGQKPTTTLEESIDYLEEK